MKTISAQATTAFGVLTLVLMFMIGFLSNDRTMMALVTMAAASAYLSMMFVTAFTTDTDIVLPIGVHLNLVFMIASICLVVLAFVLHFWS